MTVPEVLKGAFHSVKISGNFGSAVNGKRFVGSSYWKIPGESGNSKKVDPLSRLERSERNFVFHLHVSCTLYQFQLLPTIFFSHRVTSSAPPWGGGGALGYSLVGYVPPGTPNWHPVLKNFSAKIDAPF